MKTTKHTPAISALIVMCMAIGCSEYSSDDLFLTEPGLTYENLMEQGWSSFEAGNFSHAVTSFDAALASDAAKPEAHLGLGVVALAQQSYADAVVYSDSVLSRDPAYVFSHDATFSSDDLRVLYAEASFYLGKITEAFITVEALGATVENVTSIAGYGTALADPDAALTGVNTVEVSIGTHALISASSVVDTVLNVSYDVIDVAEGTLYLTVEGNPPLSEGTIVNVHYTYVMDFPLFIKNLLSQIVALKVSS